MPYTHLPKKFEGIAEATDYQKPEIDIDDDVRAYIDGVVNNPSDEHEYLVKKFTESKVILALNDWQSKYRQNDEIITNMEDHHASNDKKIEDLEKEKDELQKKLQKVKSEKHENEKHLEDINHATPTSDLNKKGTLVFLILVAIGLAVLTAYKFATAMGAISASIEGHTIITTSQYILYGLGALAILATGKIINVIYEKLHYNKGFFLSIAILSIVFAGASAYYLADDKAFLNTKTYINSDVPKLQKIFDKSKKKFDEEVDELSYAQSKGKPIQDIEKRVNELKVKKDKAEKELNSIKNRQKSMQSDAISLDKVMLILILFTEMLVGGVAWMYATDYTRYIKEDKRTHSLDTITKHIANYEEKIVSILSQVTTLEEKIEEIRLENHDLHRVVSNIKTEKEIEDVVKLIIDDETNMALSYLWKKNSEIGS